MRVLSFIQKCVTVSHDKEFYQEALPEAIFSCLQTCLLLIIIPLIEYFMYTRLCSHSSYNL